MRKEETTEPVGAGEPASWKDTSSNRGQAAPWQFLPTREMVVGLKAGAQEDPDNSCQQVVSRPVQRSPFLKVHKTEEAYYPHER